MILFAVMAGMMASYRSSFSRLAQARSLGSEGAGNNTGFLRPRYRTGILLFSSHSVGQSKSKGQARFKE